MIAIDLLGGGFRLGNPFRDASCSHLPHSASFLVYRWRLRCYLPDDIVVDLAQTTLVAYPAVQHFVVDFLSIRRQAVSGSALGHW
jgi:hypothetical protein